MHRSDFFFQSIRGGAALSRPADGAHFWRIPESPRFAESLSASESDHWQALSNRESALRYASTQGGLRTILAGYLGGDPGSIAVKRGPFGKPYVDGAPEFNLSHSAGRICAVFSGAPVGLDVESRSRPVRGLALAEKFFRAEECGRLAASAGDRQRELFLRYWVCKEAIVKLAGDGIYHGLRDAAVDLDSGNAPRGTYRGKPVWLWEFSPAEGMLGALAAWQPCEVTGFFEIL